MSERTQMQMRNPWKAAAGTLAAPRIQRKCACGQHAVGGECAECSRKKRDAQPAGGKVQRLLSTWQSGSQGRHVAPPSVQQSLQAPGWPLDRETRAFFEPRFGRDFSGVRVHSDAHSIASAGAIDALAYTVGPHIHFAAGQYAPGTSAGKRLLAHELTHVLQQGEATPAAQAPLIIDPPDSSAEREAERTSASIVSGGPAPERTAARAMVVQRQANTGGASSGTPCPSSVSLDAVKQFNYSNLPPAQQVNFRTYLGALVRHGLDPGPDHRGHCIQEELATISSDCPSTFHPCQKQDCLPINRGGQDTPTGTRLGSSPKSFLDIHFTNSTRSMLEGTGKNSCKIVCEQKYHCDNLSAPVLGTFRITRNYEASSITPPGGTPMHITTGTVEKAEVFGKGDFEPMRLPKGEALG